MRSGVAVPRLSHHERLGHREREEWRDLWQPSVLLVDLVHRPVDQGQPHDEVIAEAVQRVVGPVGLESPDRERRPLGELILEQHLNERFIAVHLIVAVHSHEPHVLESKCVHRRCVQGVSTRARTHKPSDHSHQRPVR